MADFCLDCYNKFVATDKDKATEENAIMQWDICEGCGKNKPCVIYVKTKEQLELEARIKDE